MNKMAFRIILIMLTLLSGPVNAAGGLSANKINKLAFQTGGLFIYASNWANPNSCSRNSAVVLLQSDPNYDKAYALILAAYMSGKMLSGYSDGCTEFDAQTYNTIRGHKYLTVE
ncbi:hypothetical protein J2X32_003135 [Rheinheimera pacifica]|uniref:hypothetical protein n=1 Tax=Rheinheimera pacifica TaxID=173990 RepID=UPI0028666E3F|nr:hypothetical protein [Rheinheimera pacifica]MDR6984491.1 hypothetical protein [Rheinheimera pacifica]